MITGEEVSIEENEKDLAKSYPHIVVETPIRIFDLILSGALAMGHIKHFVIDECGQLIGDSSELLDFIPFLSFCKYTQFFSEICKAVKKIFRFIPREIQILNFRVTKIFKKNIYGNQSKRLWTKCFA